MRPGIRGWRLGRRRLVCAGRRGIRPVRKPLAVGEQRRALDGSPQQAAETGPLLCQVIRRRGDDVERHAPRQRVASEPGQFARVARPLDQQEVQVAVRPHLAPGRRPEEDDTVQIRGCDQSTEQPIELLKIGMAVGPAPRARIARPRRSEDILVEQSPRHSCALPSSALAARREAHGFRIRSAIALRCSSVMSCFRLATALAAFLLPRPATGGAAPSIASMARRCTAGSLTPE